MLLSLSDLVHFLRESVNVQPIDEVTDPAYLAMTDEDIELFIKVGITRAYPDVTSISDLPDGSEYPILLLAKIELYTKLAVMKAEKVNLSGDGASISLDQRFQHYMSLVQETKQQYDSWLEHEGEGKVDSYNVLLSNRHYSKRNYENQVTPKVRVSIDNITTDSVEFSWHISNTSHFGSYKVFASDSPIVDLYRDGCGYNSVVREGSTLVFATIDIRNNHHRLSNLKPDSRYFISVFSVERNQVFGYSEVNFKTLPLLEDEEVAVETL